MRTLLLLAFFAANSGTIQTLRPEPKTKPDFLRDPGIVRSRAVKLRLHDFDKPVPFETKLDLFPDASLNIRWDYSAKLRNGSGKELTGHVEGTVAGTAALILAPNAVTGNINDGKQWLYEIRTDATGTVWIARKRQRVTPD